MLLDKAGTDGNCAATVRVGEPRDGAGEEHHGPFASNICRGNHRFDRSSRGRTIVPGERQTLIPIDGASLGGHARGARGRQGGGPRPR